MAFKDLASNLSKLHQALEAYAQGENAFSFFEQEKDFSIPLHAAAARIETYLEYLAHPLSSVLHKMALVDIEAYKMAAVERLSGKIKAFMKEAKNLPVETENLCGRLLSELKQVINVS